MNQPNPEVVYWQNVAVYLADCHAANSYIAQLKRTSKSERKRLTSIMRIANNLLNETETPPHFGHRGFAGVIQRLDRSIRQIEHCYPETRKEHT